LKPSGRRSVEIVFRSKVGSKQIHCDVARFDHVFKGSGREATNGVLVLKELFRLGNVKGALLLSENLWDVWEGGPEFEGAECQWARKFHAPNAQGREA